MKKKNPFSQFLTISFYIFLVAIVCAIIFMHYFKTKLGPGLIECAENEVKKITTIVMNNCISKYINTTNNQDILKITRNNQNEIERISYNTKEVNKMKATVTQMMDNDLAYMVRGDFEKINLNPNTISEDYYTKLNDGIIFSVSFGSATGNSLLANIGPKIPLNLSIIDDTITDIDTKITEYGINNAMVEISIKLKTTVVIQMPFLSKKITIENSIPIAIEMIQGNIPDYYLGNTLNN